MDGASSIPEGGEGSSSSSSSSSSQRDVWESHIYIIIITTTYTRACVQQEIGARGARRLHADHLCVALVCVCVHVSIAYINIYIHNRHTRTHTHTLTLSLSLEIDISTGGSSVCSFVCVYCGYKYYTYDAPARTHKQTIPTTLRPNGACPTTATAAAATATHTLVCVCVVVAAAAASSSSRREPNTLFWRMHSQPNSSSPYLRAASSSSSSEKRSSRRAQQPYYLYPSIRFSPSLSLISLSNRYRLLDR